MTIRRRPGRSGQAVIMVGVGLIALSGLMGLAVDLGWSYFVQRMEQSAADAAAMAAVNHAMDLIAGGATFDCTGLACGSGCSGNLASACTYAANNGFTAGGDGGRQNVMVDAGIPSPVPGPVPNGWAPGVMVRYWVTVRITNSVPQLFSAVLGNATGTVAARATAAITDGIINGSLIALNREGDPRGGGAGGGIDVSQTGNAGGITAGGPMIVSSNDSPLDGNHWNIPPLVVRTGTSGLPIGADMTMPDGPLFEDPMRGKGQPPVPSALLPVHPVPGGNINSTTPGCGSGVCAAGIYFATTASGCPAGFAVCTSGNPLTIGSDVTGFDGGSFGNFIFYGGVDIARTVNFGPGEYVMAGSNNGTVLNLAGTLTGGNGTDAGRLVILTDTSYPGLSPQLAQLNPYAWQPLSFGNMNIENHDTINLYGLDRTQGLPSDQNPFGNTLSDFAPAVIWQDQQNSTVAYNPNGTICTSGCTVRGTPATSTITTKHPNVTLSGLFYQPRGSALDIHFGVDSWNPGNGLQMVLGTVTYGGSTEINLGNPSTISPPMQRITTLVN